MAQDVRARIAERGAPEESNVDIVTQFAQLILAERDYQANAKSLTTFDDVTQTAINLVQQSRAVEVGVSGGGKGSVEDSYTVISK